MSFYSVCKKLFAGFFRGIFRTEIVGSENEPAEGAYLLCSNHISLMDPVIISACVKQDLRYMAKKELFHVPLLNILIRSLGAYSVDRKGNDVGAIRNTIRMLQEGESVLMFPQGTRHRGEDPADSEVKPGCAMIAKRAAVQVLPVLLTCKNNRVHLFRRVRIRIGKPIPIEELAPSFEGENYRQGAELIFSRILALKDEGETGA